MRRRTHPFAAVALPFAVMVVAAAGALRCQQLRFREYQPSTHRFIDACTDLARGRIVTVSAARTMEWDGTDWHTRPTATEPESRSGARLVYDTTRRRVLLYSGSAGATLFPELWEYDGVDWTRRTANPAPPARLNCAFAFDRGRGRAIVFGGNLYGGNLLDDTWEWDGAAWHRVLAPGPVARNEVSMAYHPGTGRTILFGGADSSAPRRDTFAFDGTAWFQLQPGTVPPRRASHRIALDEARGCLVMFGGPDPVTWEWWGNDWQPGPTGPAMRTAFGLAHDPLRNEVVLLGGATAAITTPQVAVLGDTWSYDGNRWLPLRPTGLQPRSGAGIDYDPQRDRLVVFGGGDTLTNHTHTWEWDGAAWTERTPATEPPYLQLTRLCHDRNRGRSVLFGGLLSLFVDSTTWEWDGSTWTSAQPAIAPPGRFDHAMAFDRQRGEVVLFGGRDLQRTFGDTWSWNGVRWLPLPTGPAPRSAHGMCFDVARNCTMLFGGSLQTGVSALQLFQDTWELHANGWLQRTVTNAPPPRHYHGMAHDPQRARTIVVGGRSATAPRLDCWEFDGTAWQRIRDLDRSDTMPQLVWHDRLSRLLALQPVIAGATLVSNDLWLGSTGIATAELLGSGCSGGAGGATSPQLRPFGVPVPGRSGFGLDLLGTPPQAPFLLGVAATSGQTALGHGCTLRLGPGAVSVFGTTNTDGFAFVRAPVPPRPALLGLVAVFQIGVLAPGTTAGFQLSNAVLVSIGD